ncbi:MAG TPA: helix-turn-helix transcriptional regulator [Acidimicrobiales bacterium]|nr:helix-turn-helix transcriptional regulator [Acidimicrobiales bacterium]
MRRLSELAGISNPYLSQIERGLRHPSAEILQQIAKALRISAETLYVQAGILEPAVGGGDLATHILADGSLTEDQKQALIRIYISFRNENDAGRNKAGRNNDAGRHENDAGRHDGEPSRHDGEPRRGRNDAEGHRGSEPHRSSGSPEIHEPELQRHGEGEHFEAHGRRPGGESDRSTQAGGRQSPGR